MATYPTYLFRDPLLHASKKSNVREGTPVVLHNNIDINVEGDNLLHLYITKLDEEIFTKPPDGLNELGKVMWDADNWKDLAPRIADEARKHGWCVVQFYEESEGHNERWRVFSVQRFTDFVRDTFSDHEGNTHLIPIGMKFEWGDYLGNSYREELKFDDPFTFLIMWKKGDGKSTFAFPDLTQAIMTLAIEYRQIKAQMTFSAAKPSFLHFVYGPGADDESTGELDTKVKAVNTTAALGISKQVLEEIRTIANLNIEIVLPAHDKQLQLFAGLTRLPVSYYIGERQGGGMSDMGEKTELVKVMKKKEFIFNRFKPHIIDIFSNVYDIEIDDLTLPKETTIAEVEGEQDISDDMNKEGNEPNGQED